MKTRRILALLLVLALTACLFAGCSKSEDNPTDAPTTTAPNTNGGSTPASNEVGNKRVVLLVKKLSSSYWTDLADAVQEQCDAYGWELEILCPVTADSNEEQIELLQQSLLDPPDVYLIAPADASGIAPAIEEINDAGIPIICVTNKIAEGCGDYVTYVGVQYYDIAATAASALVKHLGGSGKILFIEGTPGSSTSIDINDGAKSVFNAEAGIEILDSQPANYQRSEALTVTQNLLQKYSEVDAIFASNGEMALGAAEAVRQAGRENEIVVTALNCSQEIVQAIIDGKLLFTADDVAWKMGQQAVVAAHDYFSGVQLDKELMQDCVIVDESKLDEYKEMYGIQ